MINPHVWGAIEKFEDMMTNPKAFTDQEIQEHRRSLCLGLFMEVSELTDSFQWKFWKHGDWVNKENATREIVDIIFFLHHIARSLGITLTDLDLMFSRVLNNNIVRHIEGGDDQIG